MKFYLAAFKNYFNFDQRTARTPFWSFVLFNILFAIITFWLDLTFKLQIANSNFGYIYVTYILISFIPGIAIAIRRLHDIDKSGWNILWAFIPLFGSIYLIYLYTKPSDLESNAYGDCLINEPEIDSFINDDKTNNRILIALFSWIIFSKCFWIFLKSLNIDLFRTTYYIYYNGIVTLIWALFPLFLSMLIKVEKWKIIALILSVLYLFHSFFEYIEFTVHYNNNLQF